METKESFILEHLGDTEYKIQGDWLYASVPNRTECVFRSHLFSDILEYRYMVDDHIHSLKKECPTKTDVLRFIWSIPITKIDKETMLEINRARFKKLLGYFSWARIVMNTEFNFSVLILTESGIPSENFEYTYTELIFKIDFPELETDIKVETNPYRPGFSFLTIHDFEVLKPCIDYYGEKNRFDFDLLKSKLADQSYCSNAMLELIDDVNKTKLSKIRDAEERKSLKEDLENEKMELTLAMGLKRSNKKSTNFSKVLEELYGEASDDC